MTTQVRNRSTSFAFWAVFAAIACGRMVLHAQQPAPAAAGVTGLRVTVIDGQQYPVPGASCVLIAPSREAVASAVTDGHGVVLFETVGPGPYTVRVALDGFDPFIRADLRVPAGTVVDVGAVLVPAAVAQNVVVTGLGRFDTSVAAGSAVPTGSISRRVLQRLPLAIASVQEALPLVPGVLRSATGELSFNGNGEQQSGLRVNGMNAVDPATGGFRLSLPLDAVEAVQVFLHPYIAEYGQFTGGLTRVDTRGGGEQWHFELNDFLPDLRFVRGKVVGIAEDSPHLNLSGPLFSKRLFLSQSASYTIAKRPVRGLEFPNNETRKEGQSYFTQLDFSLHPGHAQTVTVGYAPEQRDFVGLDVFRPQPTTPSTSQRDLVLTARDNSQVLGGFLTSAVSLSRFDTRVWSQGPEELTLTPTVEAGNYFATQERRSSRVEVFAVYALPTKHWLTGSHDVKFGVDLNNNRSRLDYSARPVNIVREDGTLAYRIEFDPGRTILASNHEYVAFAQDRWTVREGLALDVGVRFEDQQLADATLIAPRAGFAWSPFADGRTVVRGGVGVFFDKVPLNIRSFARYPWRTVTRFDTDGTSVLERIRYRNVLVDAVEATTFDPRLAADQTEFVPHNMTWNVQMDRTVAPWLAVRANVVSSRTDNLYVVNPTISPAGRNVIVLSSTGVSTYRALEVTSRVGSTAHPLNVSYTRSHARGDLNEFSTIFGDVATPVVRPNAFSQLPTDAPNRLLAWGSIALPRRVTLAPVFEIRTGFPYAVRDAEQNFVGVRNSDLTRFPRFIALDLEVAKEVRITGKYFVRPSLRGFNLTNHFNPRDVHANLADPAFGGFLASYRRYFAGGFDIVF
jgi:hypothetical protein